SRHTEATLRQARTSRRSRSPCLFSTGWGFQPSRAAATPASGTKKAGPCEGAGLRLARRVPGLCRCPRRVRGSVRAVLHHPVTVGAECVALAPVRPVVAVHQRFAHLVEGLQVLDDPGEVPVRVDLVARLLVARVPIRTLRLGPGLPAALAA